MTETLYRVVDGVRVALTDTEAEAQRADWATFSAAPARRAVSALAFLERFTQAERIALREAARQNAVLDDWLDMLRAAQEVDLDDERTTAGIAAFVIGGLITAKRAAEILA